MGGEWIPGVEKTRPGLYINFISAALNRITPSIRGVVTIPFTLKWGQPKTFITIEGEDDTLVKLGYDYYSSEMLYIREVLKNAKTLLLYRLNDGIKATISWGVVSATATARWSGTRGNDLKVVASTNLSDGTKKDVKTYLGTTLVDTQTVTNIEELIANDFVTFSGTGAIENTAGASLSGGTDGAVVTQDYTDYLTATETQFFDVIGLPSSDNSLKASFAAFIARMRDEEGKKIVGVTNEYEADYEGIINVDNGVLLTDGTTLTAQNAVYWATGASAGASITESNTYKTYKDAYDANPRMTNSEIKAALEAGKFIFVHDGSNVKVEQDINSLVTFTEKPKKFSKNRVIRVLDAINNDLVAEFNSTYIGKIDNNADGHAIIKSAIIDYMETLQEAGAIKNFNHETDVVIDLVKSVDDSVFVKLAVQPVDSGEKFYFEVEVN